MKVTSLQDLLQERIRIQQQLSQLDCNIVSKIQELKSGEFVPVCSENIKSCLDAHKANLKVDDMVSFARISLQTYYNAINRVESVSVSKLNSLLGSVGLQLFVGKKLK